ncbi:Os05g0427032 [Oryza sativa Japonica Group]|uniref:Os05g0427032 protein n=1 Tax=Oryza sativa subsp. japonica TaxID=39947 RepID=A0A0P0WMN1_ORYSJ|nr:Os05g0427032 [Oryza sativa Japonica Group]
MGGKVDGMPLGPSFSPITGGSGERAHTPQATSTALRIVAFSLQPVVPTATRLHLIAPSSTLFGTAILLRPIAVRPCTLVARHWRARPPSLGLLTSDPLYIPLCP